MHPTRLSVDWNPTIWSLFLELKKCGQYIPQIYVSRSHTPVCLLRHCWLVLWWQRSIVSSIYFWLIAVPRSQWVYVSLRRLRLRKKTTCFVFFFMLFAKLVVSRQIYTSVALWVGDPTSEPMHSPRISCSTHKGFLREKQTSIIVWPSHLSFRTREVKWRVRGLHSGM